MKLLLDENLSPLHAAHLRTFGHDATSVIESGLSGASDESVRAFAINSDRILVTLDADFANLVRFPPGGTPGVIRLRLSHPAEEAIHGALQRTMNHLQKIEIGGRLAVVDDFRIRIRGGLD